MIRYLDIEHPNEHLAMLVAICQMEMFCRYTKEVLDVETAVLAEDPNGYQVVLPGRIWDTIAETAKEKGAKVLIDGRRVHPNDFHPYTGGGLA